MSRLVGTSSDRKVASCVLQDAKSCERYLELLLAYEKRDNKCLFSFSKTTPNHYRKPYCYEIGNDLSYVFKAFFLKSQYSLYIISKLSYDDGKCRYVHFLENLFIDLSVDFIYFHEFLFKSFFFKKLHFIL